jgi:hypothetical protein
MKYDRIRYGVQYMDGPLLVFPKGNQEAFPKGKPSESEAPGCGQEAAATLGPRASEGASIREAPEGFSVVSQGETRELSRTRDLYRET